MYLDLDFIYKLCQYLDLDLQVVDLCPPLLVCDTSTLIVLSHNDQEADALMVDEINSENWSQWFSKYGAHFGSAYIGN